MITKERLKAAITEMLTAWGQIGTVGMAKIARAKVDRLDVEVTSSIDDLFEHMAKLQAQSWELDRQIKLARAAADSPCLGALELVRDTKPSQYVTQLMQRTKAEPGPPSPSPDAELRFQLASMAWTPPIGHSLTEQRLVKRGFDLAASQVKAILGRA